MIGLLRRRRQMRAVPAIPLRPSDIPADVREAVATERRERERRGTDRRTPIAGGPLDQRHLTKWALREACHRAEQLDQHLPVTVTVTPQGEIRWELAPEATLSEASELAWRLDLDEHTADPVAVGPDTGQWDHRWTGAPFPGTHRSWLLWTGAEQ